MKTPRRRSRRRSNNHRHQSGGEKTKTITKKGWQKLLKHGIGSDSELQNFLSTFSSHESQNILLSWGLDEVDVNVILQGAKQSSKRLSRQTSHTESHARLCDTFDVLIEILREEKAKYC